MRGHAGRRMFMTGAAIWALVALWGAVAWSHPGPRRKVTLAERPAAASASRVPVERSVTIIPTVPPVQWDSPPVRHATPRPVRRWTPPSGQVRRAPVVRVLPRYVAPVTTTQTS